MEDTRVWAPECLNDTPKEFGHSALGFITPCCWCDKIFDAPEFIKMEKRDPKLAMLYRDHLKIENNKSIREIFESEEWQQFYQSLLNGPEEAAETCKKYCWREIGTGIKKISTYGSSK